MLDRRDRTRTELSVTRAEYNVGLKRPTSTGDARTGRAMTASARAWPLGLPLAAVAHWHRRARAPSSRRPASIYGPRQRHDRLVLEAGPGLRRVRAFRKEFGGTRTLIVALEGDIIFLPRSSSSSAR